MPSPSVIPPHGADSNLVYHHDFHESLPTKYANVLNRIPPGSRILELGCHTGSFGAYLVRTDYKVDGIDINPDAVQYARSAGVNAILGDLEDSSSFKALSNVYDVVLAMDVLEHLRTPETILHILRNIIAPGGKLIVTGPNIAYWAMRKDLLLGNWEYHDDGILDRTHLRFYTRRGWENLFIHSGYRILATEAADDFIPFEHILRRMPLFGRLAPELNAYFLKRFPTFFACVFLFEAVVDNNHTS